MIMSKLVHSASCFGQKYLFLLLGFTCLLMQAFAATNTPSEAFEPWGKGRDLPIGFKVSLVGDRTNYFLGENILLYYRIENAGLSPFEISVGGDYRGSTRADRFKVSAVSADGTLVADPTPLMLNFGGGLSPLGEIKPGGEWFENVYVSEYCRFDSPGTYTVRAFHDLGFGQQRTNDPRTVALTIELRAPTEMEARAILVEAEKAKPSHGTTWGLKGEARLRYPCIRWPTFLKPLEERAQQGNESAVIGIASIRTLDASRALVGLLVHTNATLAAMAAQLLDDRLPHPESDFTGPWGPERRQYILENVWEDTLTPLVRNYCVQLLQGTKRSDLMSGASLLRLVGTAQEVPALQRALDFAVAQTNTEYLADIHYPAPIRAADLLLRAVLTLQPNLDVEPNPHLSPGELVLFLARHGASEKPLSCQEEVVFVAALQDPLPYVRMKALDQLPKEIPLSLVGGITHCLTDSNVGVQNYAFQAAQRMQEPKHLAIALEVLKTAPDEWLLRAAKDIAQKYGGRYNCAVILASRLTVRKDHNDYLPREIFSQLFGIVFGNKTGGNLKVPRDAETARALSACWLDFLKTHQRSITDGQLLKLCDLPDNLGIDR
jgi:hypothetical protein